MDTPFNVLSLEDSDLDFEIISEHLIRAGYNPNITRAATENEFILLISKNSYDIILADYNLPQFDAFDALKICNLYCPEVPFICVSGSIGEIMAIELLKMGAVDYVIKDRLERLPFAVKRALGEAKEKKALKLAEEELRKNEEKFRTLTENIPDIIARFDKDLKHIYINPAIEKVTGISPGAFIGKTNQELGMPAENVITWDKHMHFVFQTAEQLTYEFNFQTPEGTTIYFLSMLVPEVGENGKVNTILNVTRDISEQKNAEIALKKSEERLRDIIFSTADWVWEVDENGFYTYSSIKGSELFEISQEDIIGKTPFAFMPPDEAERIGKIFAELVALRAPIHNLENWNIAKNGKKICLLTNGVPIIDKEGNFRGYRGVDINITERKLAEETLRQSEAELNFSQEIADMGSWEYDFATQRIKCSRNMYQMLGLGVDKNYLTFADLKKLVHPDDLYLLEATISKIEIQREPVSFDFRYQLDNERILWVQNNIIPSFEHGILSKLQGINIDITGKKQTEQELLSAKGKAEASDKLKTAFLNNISHEIRTPLNGILGFAPLIIDPDCKQDEKEKFLEILNESSKRLMQTITDYMDASLIASDNMEIRKSNFAVDEILNEIEKEFIIPCTIARIEFYVEKPLALKDVIMNSDIILFKKILSHLLTNAIKFTKQGKILLAAKVNGESLEIVVNDTGVGIKEDAMESVFKHFMQEETANTRGHEGSGLGLSIVQGLVRILGGTIGVESVKGTGSTFVVTIPGIITNNEKVKRTEEIKPKSIEFSPVILIVEDDPASRLYIELMLHTNYQILKAEDGSSAVDMCKNIPDISLVLMDVKMPGMSGLEATEIIKKTRKDLPIIALTAYAETGMRDKCMDAGCDEYISKPVERTKLLAMLLKFGIDKQK